MFGWEEATRKYESLFAEVVLFSVAPGSGSARCAPGLVRKQASGNLAPAFVAEGGRVFPPPHHSIRKVRSFHL
jgi:hypothetical protein